MKSIWEIPFIVVDVETSGSNSTANRIMDIACVTTIGGEITNVYSSLINPHEPIPPFVSKMTGITDEMTYFAPEAGEVLERIADLFYYKNAVFVAHNARFDWAFLVETFKRNGYPKPTLPRLCTLKLSRRVLPKKIKKNLDELSAYLDINITNRHRASGDAIATAHILNELLEMAENEHGITTVDDLLKFQNKPIRNIRIPLATKKAFASKLEELPNSPGVFLFQDEHQKVLYVSKAKSIRNHVYSYFNGEVMTSKRIASMFKIVDNIQWETTNSELSAGILETDIIKKFNPPFNTALKINRNFPFIKLNANDGYPFLELTFTIKNDGNHYYGPFKNVSFAYQIIRAIEKKYKIRKCDFQLEPDFETLPCYYYDTGRCDAPCAMKITKEQYSIEIGKVKKFLAHQQSGTIQQLEAQISNLPDSLDKAGELKKQITLLKKNFDNRYANNPDSLKGNIVLINPISSEKLAELIILKNGTTIHNELVGTRTDLHKILNLISREFYNNGYPSDTDIGEDFHIINKFHHRHNNRSILIVCDNKSEADCLNEIVKSIRSINFTAKV